MITPNLPAQPAASKPAEAPAQPPNEDRAATMLGLLERGFFTDSTRFHQMQSDMSMTLLRARALGSHEAIDGTWQQRWDLVEGILCRINDQLSIMDNVIISGDSESLSEALTAWKTIQAEDSLLVSSLNDLHTQALEWSPASRKDWNLLVLALEQHVETIHACSQAFRAKLELLKQHSKEEVEVFVQNLIAQLPSRTTAKDAAAAAYAAEYDKAATDIQAEQHQTLGLLDTIKAMFLWVDSPEERIEKNHQTRLDAA